METESLPALDRTAVAQAAESAVDAAEERQQQRAEKRARWRAQWDKTRREYLQQLEIDRLKRLCEVVEHRLHPGRQQSIPEEKISTVLELHAAGEPLLTSCEALGFSRMQFMRRVMESDELRERLAQAREQNAHAKVDGSWAIARTEPDVDRARLLTDLCRWEVSKVLPTLYGDRLKVDAPDGVVFSLNIGQLAEKTLESGK